MTFEQSLLGAAIGRVADLLAVAHAAAIRAAAVITVTATVDIEPLTLILVVAQGNEFAFLWFWPTLLAGGSARAFIPQRLEEGSHRDRSSRRG